MIVQALKGVTLVGWADPLTRLFLALHKSLDAPCNDPTRLGDPLDSSLSLSDRMASKQALELSQWYIASAKCAAAQHDIAECFGYWQRVFPITS